MCTARWTSKTKMHTRRKRCCYVSLRKPPPDDSMVTTPFLNVSIAGITSRLAISQRSMLNFSCLYPTVPALRTVEMCADSCMIACLQTIRWSNLASSRPPPAETRSSHQEMLSHQTLVRAMTVLPISMEKSYGLVPWREVSKTSISNTVWSMVIPANLEKDYDPVP